MKTVAFCAFATTLALSGFAFAATGDSEEETQHKRPAASTPASATGEKSDHEQMVGHFAVGYMGASQIPIAVFAAGPGGGAVTADNVTTPFVGGRYWLSAGMGIDLGLGLAFSGGSTTTTTPAAGAVSVDAPSRTGIGLHAGVPLALAYTKHFTFELVPELTFGYASSTIKANIVAGQPASPDISQSGLRFDLGGRVGGELHFGFMGVPQLSLQATVGLGFRYSSVKVSLSDNSFSQSSGGPSFGTSVQDAPWAIFTNNVSALYYF